MENPTFHLEGVVKSRDDVQDFEGPLSLILMLLSKNKIEIRDISISDILDQYLAYLDEMQRMDLEVASEFVQMAAYLLYIKTRTLLAAEEEVTELEQLMSSLEQLKAKDAHEAVKTVLSALCGAEIGIDLALASGCAPANADCYDDERVANDELVQAMRSTAEIAVPMPNIPEMDVMWTVVSNLLTDVNLSGEDVDAAFDEALSEAESLIANMQ